jgi:predicted HicB family RNase H-like nuclease
MSSYDNLNFQLDTAVLHGFGREASQSFTDFSVETIGFNVEEVRSRDMKQDSLSPQSPEPSQNQKAAQETTRSVATQKRVSLQISSNLHRAAKLAALDEEETLNSLMVRLLRRYLTEREANLDKFRRGNG